MTEPTANGPTWYDDPERALNFARILTAAGTLESAHDVLDYIAAPRKYDPEHDLWNRTGCPRPPSADDAAQFRSLPPNSPQAIALRQRHRAAASTWSAFCDLLNAYHQSGVTLRAL